jgi:hypothetical protein
MSQDYTMAMFNLGRMERAQSNANEWRDYAKQLEKKCVELGSGLEATAAVVNEMVDELNGEKPRVLSDPANKHLRLAFREKQKRISEAQLAGKNPLSF